MIPVLNALNVNIAVFGNHDFGKFQLYSQNFISRGCHLKITGFVLYVALNIHIFFVDVVLQILVWVSLLSSVLLQHFHGF